MGKRWLCQPEPDSKLFLVNYATGIKIPMSIWPFRPLSRGQLIKNENMKTAARWFADMYALTGIVKVSDPWNEEIKPRYFEFVDGELIKEIRGKKK